MYTQRRRFGGNRNRRDEGRFSYGRRNGGGRGFKERSFDPSFLVKQEVVEEKVLEYIPKHSFSDFEIHDGLKRAIQNHGYVTPTPIQDQAIPAILEGRDVVGIANTGTGKTAAFLIPILNKLFHNRSERVLIIAPTRELAVQIQDELLKFSTNGQIYSVLCIGGVGINPQIGRIRKNPHVVIGTPGRLRDLEERRVLQLSQFSTIVLDEVDRMLDMGFIHDIRYLVGLMARKRHSLFFSATMTPTVQGVMRDFLNNPITISVKTRESSANVDQDIVKIGGRNKIDVLHDLLQQEGFDRVLVFGRTKHGTEKLAKELYQRRVSVASIHGNKSQFQRQRAIEEFKASKVQVLLATDVVARMFEANQS
jgi:superfamily II DNA/RNA helicase